SYPRRSHAEAAAGGYRSFSRFPFPLAAVVAPRPRAAGGRITAADRPPATCAPPRVAAARRAAPAGSPAAPAAVTPPPAVAVGRAARAAGPAKGRRPVVAARGRR